MMRSPVFPRSVSQILGPLRGLGKTWSFKTSGAGGEDALILFGPEEAVEQPGEMLRSKGWKKLQAQFPADGIQLERTASHDN